MENQEFRNFKGKPFKDEDDDETIRDVDCPRHEYDVEKQKKSGKPEIFATAEVITILGRKSEMIAELQTSYSQVVDANSFKVYQHNYFSPIQELMEYMKKELKAENQIGAYRYLIALENKAVEFLRARLQMAEQQGAEGHERSIADKLPPMIKNLFNPSLADELEKIKLSDSLLQNTELFCSMTGRIFYIKELENGLTESADLLATIRSAAQDAAYGYAPSQPRKEISQGRSRFGIQAAEIHAIDAILAKETEKHSSFPGISI